MVVHDFFGAGGGGAGLVGGDVLREEIAPVVVGVVLDVAVCVCRDAWRSDRADVVGFAVVVPGEDLGGEMLVGKLE